MSTRILLTIASAALLASSAVADGSKISKCEILIPDVELRPGVTVSLSVNVYEKSKGGCANPAVANLRTIFAVHGFAHTANTWAPFAKTILRHNPTGFDVCRVVALDLPGRGGSSLPDGLLYQDLTLEDHVTAIQGALEGLATLEDIRPHILVGHSQGGLLVQMLQDRLRDMSSSLAAEYDIRNVVLLSPVPPAEVYWELSHDPQLPVLMTAFLRLDPERGYIWLLPDDVWATFSFFLNLFREVVPRAPTPEEVTEFGYNAAEPLQASLELTGLPPEPGMPPTPRPSVAADIFGEAAMTRFSVVAFEHDVMVRASENHEIFEYLTGGGGPLEFFAVVEGTDTVHSMFLTDPGAMLRRLVGTGVRF